MSRFPSKFRAWLLILPLVWATGPVFGARTDRTAGRPLIEAFAAKDLGSTGSIWHVLEDKLGRLFVGSDGLHVFDGQEWRTFPVGTSSGLRGMAFGSDGRLWAGATNEAGYFIEESLGAFRYHSLITRLPKEDQQVGEIWGCAPVGNVVYYLYRRKILRWDGTSWQIHSFPGDSRLFQIRFGEEQWFHHLETGLYRLTESGPRLEIEASALPKAGVLGMERDAKGLILATGLGLFRPGDPPVQVSNSEQAQFISVNRLSDFAKLADDSYLIGTLNGLMIASGTGETLRTWNINDGLPSDSIQSFRLDAQGYVWNATPNGVFNFEIAGHASVFASPEHLRGGAQRLVRLPENGLLAFTYDGVYQLRAEPGKGGRFEQLKLDNPGNYYGLPVGNKVLFFRHGGIDVWDGSTTRTVVKLTGNSAYWGAPIRSDPKAFHILTIGGLYRLTEQPDGSFQHAFLATLPDFALNAHEDVTGRLWIGTTGRGVFTYDSGTSQFSPVANPSTGQPVSGSSLVVSRKDDILLLGMRTVLQARPDGNGLRALAGAPDINPVAAVQLPDEAGLVVAFKRPAPRTKITEGLGVMTVEKNGRLGWQELDVPGLRRIGSIATMAITQENGKSVIWIGGTDGILRLDYDAIPAVQKPTAPLIHLDLLNAGRIASDSDFAFSFQRHRLNFHLFTGEHTRSRDWFIQIRLGNAAWSVPDTRRSFGFSNLSEGDYRFEARTINPAGHVSEPAVFAFRILPPWYRSKTAYSGYAIVVLLAGFGFVRIRERRIRARNAELESLVNVRTAELVKANAAKDEFLAGISHEIRNPMNGVIGIAENFRTDALDGESRRKFSLLRQCATHLSSLLEDILDFSKVQAGAIELEPKPFDLHEIVESVAAITRADSERYGIPVEVAISPAVPRKLIGDARRIRQILINFVSNALKFSGRGQVSVTVWCKEAGAGSSEVIFAVSDEGPGISAEEQARLFTRFERGAAAQKGRVPGTGLGLALSRGLAEKMGGRIWLESEVGHGSCFYFSATLPIAEAPADIAAPPAASPAAARTALVVDDQEYNRIVLSDLLQSMGFAVQSAQEGQAALALAARHAFDVIFLDFNLPGLSGVDVARGIRTQPGASAHALILATTAFTTSEKRAQCLDAGMDAFLGKPVTRERLAKAIAGLTPPAGPSQPAPTPKKADRPADPLGNMKLLARKKGVPIADELALYLSELDQEFARLNDAIAAENPDEAGRFAHMLCGRCSFIYERELEQVQRRIEAAAAAGRWTEARRDSQEFTKQLAELRVRLGSSGSEAAPRG